MQFTKKRKIMILTGMFVLLAITGYLNFTLNNNSPEIGGAAQTNGSLIATFEQTRSSQRAMEIAHLTAIRESSTATEAQKAEALEKLEAIYANQNFETRCESLIKASFNDAIVSRSNGIVTILVQNPTEISETQAALVESIVWEQSGKPADFDWESVFLTVIE